MFGQSRIACARVCVCMYVCVCACVCVLVCMRGCDLEIQRACDTACVCERQGASSDGGLSLATTTTCRYMYTKPPWT